MSQAVLKSMSLLVLSLEDHTLSSLNDEEIPITYFSNIETLKYLSLYFSLEMKFIEFI